MLLGVNLLFHSANHWLCNSGFRKCVCVCGEFSFMGNKDEEGWSEEKLSIQPTVEAREEGKL